MYFENNTTKSQGSIADWMSFCREVCFVCVDDFFGREECYWVVQEYRWKWLVEGSWALGMIEINVGIGTVNKRERSVSVSYTK